MFSIVLHHLLLHVARSGLGRSDLILPNQKESGKTCLQGLNNQLPCNYFWL